MSEGQKIIKYLALAFAIFLSFNIIIGIISAIIFGVGIFGTTLGLISENEDTGISSSKVHNVFSEEYSDIDNLKIECDFANLIIEQGNELKVEAKNVNNKFYSKKVGDTLKIVEDKNFNIFNNNVKSEIKIYIPGTQNFKDIKIDTGAGNLKIDKLISKNLKLELGAGNVEISNIIVENNTDINGGVGKVDIQSSVLNNLDLDMGVGNFNIDSEIIGNSKIDSGVGNLSLRLLGKKEDYKILSKRGIGSFKIDNVEAQDNEIYGDGENYIKISSGIGKIDLIYNND